MSIYENDYVYFCPRCNGDTLHYITKRKQDILVLTCSYCHTPSLVKNELLTYNQLRWEDELRQILNNLDHPFDEP